ncbi:hypothetical protein ECP03019043_4775 [Escherichia coli P0301904.3]|nr:hypothetical protein ECP03019043_4775 [Escherichia coli P0301904.3]
MVDDFCQRGATPVFLNRLFSKLCQLSFNDLNIQSLRAAARASVCLPPQQ